MLLNSVANLIREDNRVIHIAEEDKKRTLTKDLSSIIKCCFIHIPDFTLSTTENNAQMVCRYEDTGFIL